MYNALQDTFQKKSTEESEDRRIREGGAIVIILWRLSMNSDREKQK